jgi:hypothetical protein
VIVAVDEDDGVLAFMNLIFIPNPQEISMDLMRRRTNAPNGIMDYLFIELFLYTKSMASSASTWEWLLWLVSRNASMPALKSARSTVFSSN